MSLSAEDKAFALELATLIAQAVTASITQAVTASINQALTAALSPLLERGAARELRDIARDALEIAPRDAVATDRHDELMSNIACDAREIARDARDASRDARDASRDARDIARDARDIARDAREIARDAHEIARDAREIARDALAKARHDELMSCLCTGSPQHPPFFPSLQAAAAGAQALQALAGCISSPAPSKGPPAASPLAVLAMCTASDEASLVYFLTPTLQLLRSSSAAQLAADPCAPVLVSSERRPWLDGWHVPLGKLRIKPDLFLVPAPCWRGYTSLEGAAVGVLADRCLPQEGCVLEVYKAKQGTGELTPSDFGELVDCHACLPGLARGALFNARALWLYESQDGRPQRLIQTTWEAGGSRALVSSFFGAPRPEPPLVHVLRSLMQQLQLKHCEVGEEGTGSFLGAGGSGRVFCVQQRRAGSAAQPQRLALKVCTAASGSDLTVEFATLQAAFSRGAPVARLVPGTLQLLYSSGAAGSRVFLGSGYLLAEVLQPLAPVASQQRCREVFAALAALHAAGFAHGDARMPNLLARELSDSGGEGQQLVWIDMRLELCSSDALAADAEQLALSVLGLHYNAQLPAAVDAEVVRCHEGGGPQGGYVGLADAVFSGLP
jgi:hypothetical protein